MEEVRTRYAPSPTGMMQFGNLRTALFSYALAKHYGGKFILRIEDTDRKRYVEGAVDKYISLLQEFGLKYDEGPDIGGPYGPYIQSQRLNIYKEKAIELVEKGYAYYCFCTEDRLQQLSEKQKQNGEKTCYDRKCRNIDPKEAQSRVNSGEKYVIRLKVPQNRKIVFQDAIYGDISWDTKDVEDAIMLKSDGYPTYHLGVVIDDVMMKITHITRGTEWLPSVPKHVILFEGFNYPIPQIAHLPLILDPTGGKLSKRKRSTAVEEYKAMGYLNEAIMNFIMFLGWSPKTNQEIISLEKFVELFSFEKINKTAGVFNPDKLLWFNGKYIRNLSDEEFVLTFLEWLKKYYTEDIETQNVFLNDKNLIRKLQLIRERVNKLSEIPDMISFYYKKTNISQEEIDKLGKIETLKLLIKEHLLNIQDLEDDSQKWDQTLWADNIRNIAKSHDIKPADLFMLIRVIITGKTVSPPLFEALQIIGKNEYILRLNLFIKK